MIKKNRYQKITSENIEKLKIIGEIRQNNINTGVWYFNENMFILATNEGLFLLDLSESFKHLKNRLSENIYTDICLSNTCKNILAINNNGFSSDKSLQVGFFIPTFLYLSNMREFSLGLQADSDYCIMKFNHNDSLFAADGEYHIYLWDVDSRKLIFETEGQGICWNTQDNSLFYISPDDKSIMSYSISNKSVNRIGTVGNDYDLLFFQSLDFLNYSKTLIGIFSNYVKIWPHNCFHPIVIDSYNILHKTALSPDEKILAAIGSGSEMQFIDIQNHKELHVLDAEYANCNNIDFSPNGTMIALVTCTDKVIFFGVEDDES